MPILNDPPKESDWIDPDEVPRPVVTYGFARAYVDGLELDFHRHTKGQIVLVQCGALSCEMSGNDIGIDEFPQGNGGRLIFRNVRERGLKFEASHWA